MKLAAAPVSSALDAARFYERMVAEVTARSLRSIRRRVEKIVFLAAARRDGDEDAIERLAAELLVVIAEERHWIRAEHAALKKAIESLDETKGGAS